MVDAEAELVAILAFLAGRARGLAAADACVVDQDVEAMVLGLHLERHGSHGLER